MRVLHGHWFAVFTKHGVALHGLAHESASFEPESPKPWVFGLLPAEFAESLLHEPAFGTSNSTYCVWRLADASEWSRGAVPDSEAHVDDGMVEHLTIIAESASDYRAFAEEYHETVLSLADVEAVFGHEPVTPELANKLNSKVDYATLLRDLRDIGYSV